MWMLQGSPHSFLGASPDWSLAGADLKDGRLAWQLDHGPFHWADGVWETEIAARPLDAPESSPLHVMLRVAPETLRNWKALHLDPIVEACAQLKDHLKRAPREDVTLLTLL